MTLTAANVRVGATGAVYFAPIATALPTNATTALISAYTNGDVGYISDAGVTQTVDESITDIRAWQGGDVVRKVQTSHDVTFDFEMIETSTNTLTTFYGGYTTGLSTITSTQLPHQRMVLEVIDGAVKLRIVLPDAQITERGDVTYASDDAVKYPVTVTAYPDGTGVKAYIYKDPA